MTEAHIGDLKLRRLRAGEVLGPEAAAINAHAATCAQCRARVKDLDDEQRRFEQDISFDRFAAGVERAARRPAAAPAASSMRWMVPALGVAAALVLVVTFSGRQRFAPINRAKGGADVVVRIGGDRAPGGSGSNSGQRGQRVASSDAPESLARGERLRIGYKAGPHRYLTAVALDDQGHATALYPESGRSLALPTDTETHYLPDSIELTGAGAERVVVVLSDQAVDVDAVKRAAEAAYRQARGDILHLPALNLAGEQFHRTFLKPQP
jgi:hypothetical protein